jgi:DNA replication protein DnaC
MEIKNLFPPQLKSTPGREWENSNNPDGICLTEEEKDWAYIFTLEKKIRENPHEIIMDLTDEEKFEAWEKTLGLKIAKANESKYWKFIKSPIEEKKMTAEELYKLSMKVGRALIEGFKLNDEEKEIFGLLALYFAGDKRFETKGKFSLKKGICLYGNIGCGKTTALNIFRTIVNPPFALLSCQDIANEFKSDGPEVIGKYAKYISLCLDDLGTETSGKHYGNESNVIMEILLARYNQEMYKQFMTHITTNLDSNQIGECYGMRVRDRCRQMFNQICFPENSESKRK